MFIIFCTGGIFEITRSFTNIAKLKKFLYWPKLFKNRKQKIANFCKKNIPLFERSHATIFNLIKTINTQRQHFLPKINDATIRFC